ncbi:polysaccharide deacetylase family protein [Methyloceanibacter sp.]|uniref:polysaccharide deacetylase family protein n=1 Tax=Methyloceanibacter sp. TaxID=1965321 RepID=UPI002D324F9E|nr:polysaccharide deacetylase family protein [Methyloceanibacter sp.]HZP08925.1 polysaccharide deacetylase family protein [Methyloceanibacter sp.]
MAKIKTAMMKAAMSGLYHTGAHRLLAPYTQGVGLIFTLHQVHPEPAEPKAFAPNRILEVTPGFLDAVIDQVQEAGLDIVSLDEAVRRLREEDPRRFVSFTFDDGYRDNLEYAYPLFRKRSLPLTLYVPTDYPDGKGELWWIALEEIVARAEEIELCRDGALWTLPTATMPEKYRAYNEIYWWLRRIDEATQRQVVRALAERYDVDMGADCRRLIMGWDEIRQLAEDPLVTIGAHTKSHFAIAKLPPARALDEMTGSASRIERELGVRPLHFAFPYGDPGSAGPRDFALAREAGFKTAVTTRKGMLFPAHRPHLAALPRVSLNGEYQSLSYTALYLSGAPFALWNRFRQVSAA